MLKDSSKRCYTDNWYSYTLDWVYCILLAVNETPFQLNLTLGEYNTMRKDLSNKPHNSEANLDKNKDVREEIMMRRDDNNNNRKNRKNGNGEAAKRFPWKQCFNQDRRVASLLCFVIVIVTTLGHIDHASEDTLGTIVKVISAVVLYLCQKYCPQHLRTIKNCIKWITIVTIILIWLLNIAT